jgi:hypothetical protein
VKMCGSHSSVAATDSSLLDGICAVLVETTAGENCRSKKPSCCNGSQSFGWDFAGQSSVRRTPRRQGAPSRRTTSWPSPVLKRNLGICSLFQTLPAQSISAFWMGFVRSKPFTIIRGQRTSQSYQGVSGVEGF